METTSSRLFTHRFKARTHERVVEHVNGKRCRAAWEASNGMIHIEFEGGNSLNVFPDELTELDPLEQLAQIK